MFKNTREGFPVDVIYWATEGRHSVSDRCEALRLVDGPAPDFRVITKSINLFDHREFEEFASAIGGTYMLVIDTLGRLFGSLGADENGPDMARFVGTLDRLREICGMQIVLLHHPAISGASRPRGNSSLIGAADTIIEHELLGDGSRTATLRQARDDPAGQVLRYRLRIIDLPPSEWINGRRSVIADEMDETVPLAAPVSKPRQRGRRRAASG